MSGTDSTEPASGHPYVFVSYSSTDLARVEAIVAALDAAGFGVWFDRRDIPVGAIYGPEIVAGIERSDVVIIACSEQAFKSPHVRQEILLAFKYRRPPLPVMLERLKFPRDLEYWLVGPQRIDAHALDSDAWLAALVAAVDRLSSPADADNPPREVSESPEGNLTVPTTPLIGRSQELSQLRESIGKSGSRLITLVGPGGTGKTRLALQAAVEQRDQFPDGIYLIELGPISDPNLIWTSLRLALGVDESPGRSSRDSIVSLLAGKGILFVFDNCEHLRIDGELAVAAVVVDLLAAAPGVAVLATSREPLHVHAEQQFPVLPLALPDPTVANTVTEIGKFDAIDLFVSRAKAVKPAFNLSDDNVEAVARICSRLDGLPLAIELAAARIKMLSPSALLARLDQRLPLLTQGAVDLPRRQRTLRDTIAWSYELLNVVEQQTFERIAVFAGGWTIDAADRVVGLDDPILTFDVHASLVDKNLILQTDDSTGEPRFTMLSTIQEFASDLLRAGTDEADVRLAHATYFQQLAAEARPGMEGPDQAVWLERLASEIDNLRLALDWTDANDPDQGLLTATDLWRYWLHRANFSEGKARMQAAYAAAPGAAAPLRAKCLRFCGNLAYLQSDYAEATDLQQKSLEIARSAGDQKGVAQALNNLAMVANAQGQNDRAESLYQESLEISRGNGSQDSMVVSLNNLGNLAGARGDYQRAKEFYEQGLEITRSVGNQVNLANTLNNLGIVARNQGVYDAAVSYFTESLAIYRILGDRSLIATVLGNLGRNANVLGDHALADKLLQESLDLTRELGHPTALAYSLSNLGRVAADRQDWQLAATYLHEVLSLYSRIGNLSGIAGAIQRTAELLYRAGFTEAAVSLHGAAHSFRAGLGEQLPSQEQEDIENQLDAARSAFGLADFEVIWEAGTKLSIDAACEHGLAALQRISQPSTN